MSSAAVSTHSGAGPLGLMSCVRESSPPQDLGNEYDMDKNVPSKKKFWDPRKWFKRKPPKTPEEGNSSNEVLDQKETVRSRSASELSINEEPKRRRSSNSINPGLSVSHDSVFPHSGSELELDAAKSTSSLSIHQPILPDHRLQTELTERLRLRRGRGDTSEDDEGLPRSPCNSPTTTEELLDKTAIKDLPTKSHSTCSDGSLLSMGSSEMDEDSIGQTSRNSSKLCLLEKKSSVENDSGFELGSLSAPLNHSAAHHKVAVKPKRTHGVPRRRRVQQLNASALPTTPEVNEDSSVKSLTPDTGSKESVSELKSMPHRLSEIQIKCSSLPPGLAAPGADETKLIRSRSNAGSKSHEILGEEEEEDRKEKADKSFLGRFFPRRSGRKKKTKDEKVNIRQSTTTDYYSSSSSRLAPVSSTYSRQTINIDSNLAIRPNALVRSGPASRQRVQPIDIPASPDLVLRREREESLIMPKPSPEKSFAGTSPLHAELESHFRTKLTSMSKSPPISPKLSRIVPATPPKSPRSRMGTGMEESSRSKMKLPALSTLQQRVLLLKDEPDLSSNHKSLEMLETLPPKQPITKSHSFKSAKSTPEHTFITSKYRKEQVNANKVKTAEEASSAINITKSISLDSVTTIPEHTQEPKRAQNHLAKNTDVLHESKMYPITLRSIGDNKTRETSTSTSTSSSSTKTTTTNTASDETAKMTSKKETETSEQHRSVKQETVEYQRTITMDASSDSDLISKFLANAKPHSNSNSVEVSNESSVTISGPSHTAIVSVGDVNSKQTFTENVQTEVIKDDNFNKEIRIKEQQISVTKIQLKRETSSQVSMGKKNPDFLNVQLNKVETKPLSNVVLSTTPKIIDEQKKATKIASQDATKHQEALPEATKTIPQETAKTVKTTQESAKPRPQEATKARPQEVSKTTQETSKVAPQEASKVASLEAAKVVFQETSKVAFQEASKVAFQETSKVAKVQETTKLTVQETSKVAFQEVTKTKEPTKFATPETPKFLNQETKKEATKQTNQDTGKKKIEQKSPVLDCKRKFSSDDIEIIENDNNLNNNNTNQNNNVSTAFVTITTMTPPVSARMFKKHSETQISQQRKSSLVCESNNKEKPILRAKSCSLEITDSAKKTSEDNSDRLVSQKSLDDLENKKKAKADKALNITDNVVLRKKMMVKQKQDDEPELMKVFARRSLKLKDNEVEELSQQVILSVEDSVNMNKSRDSDKENQSDSPSEERKFTNNIKESVKNKEETCEVNLRKPINNKINAFQKAVSLNTLINTEIITNEKLQKQSSLIERPKTDGWIMKNNDSVTIERKNEDDVISNTMENDYINEETIKPKNVNQRKAEWEKRAQEAKKKTMP